jgi:hypothetical protein
MKRASRNSRNGRRGAPRRNSSKKLSIEELKREVAAMHPFMAEIFKIADRVPKEDWKTLPRDLSYNLDHYLYGFPKKKLRKR